MPAAFNTPQGAGYQTLTINSATFVQDFSSLVVSEFMYNPSAPTPAEIAAGHGDSEDFEFIEVLNTGAGLLDLSGLQFVEGITFDFSTGSITSLAAGARLLLVEDLSAFAFRYGAGHPLVESTDPYPFLGVIELPGGGGTAEFLTVSFTHTLAADGISVSAQISTDLTNWASGTGYIVLHSRVLHGDGTATSVYRAANPIVAGTRQFIRAHFETPGP